VTTTLHFINYSTLICITGVLYIDAIIPALVLRAHQLAVGCATACPWSSRGVCNGKAVGGTASPGSTGYLLQDSGSCFCLVQLSVLPVLHIISLHAKDVYYRMG